MQNSQLRFIAVEHMPLMILGAISAYLEFRSGKSKVENPNKLRAGSIWNGLATPFLIIEIPWFRLKLPF